MLNSIVSVPDHCLFIYFVTGSSVGTAINDTAQISTCSFEMLEDAGVRIPYDTNI